MDEIKVKKGWFGFGKAKEIEISRIPLEGQMQTKKRTMSFKPEEFVDLAKVPCFDSNKRL